MTEPVSPIFEDQEPEPLHEVLAEYDEDHKEIEYIFLERLPGPGFLESVGWTFAAMISQVIGSIIAVIVILAVYAFSVQIPPEQIQGKLEEPEFLKFLMTSYAGLNLGIIMATFMLTIFGIVFIRLGSHRRRAIPIQLPSSWHVLLTFLWVLPLSVLCGQLGMYAGLGWEKLAEVIPSLRGMDDLNIMESIGEVIAGMPHWLVYLLVAVCPAVSEELLFRVLIGRGLVARHGILVGIGLTTLLFAAVHLHPVHVIALIPLSVAIHVSYLASRTIWIPMLAHFLNNSLAVGVVLNMDAEATADAAVLDGFLPWWATLAAALLALMIGWVYWQTRLTWSDDDQKAMPEPFVSADRDLTDEAFQLGWKYPPVKALMALALSMCFFMASMAMVAQ